MVKIETERLMLREWKVGEEHLLKQFLGDNQVMYAYEGAFNDAQIADWLVWNVTSYHEKGYGLWAIERKSDGKVIGECGLTDQQIDGEEYLEIGYHLVLEAWHNGYMTEAAQAVKDYAFEKLNACKVVSIIRDTNIHSMNVAIRNDMIIVKRVSKQYKGIEMPHYIFQAKHHQL